MELLVRVTLTSGKNKAHLSGVCNLEGDAKDFSKVISDFYRFLDEYEKNHAQPKPDEVQGELPEEPKPDEAQGEVPEEPKPDEAQGEVHEEPKPDEVQGELPEEPKPDEAQGEVPEEPKPDEAQGEVPEEPKPDEAQGEVPEEPKPTKARIPNKADVQQIPQLEEIAKNCSSYEEFVKEVAIWISVGSKMKFFLEVVKAAEQAEKISWNNIEEIMSRSGEAFNSYGKLFCTNQVAATFKNSENPVTILKLIKAIVEYKIYDFDQKVETIDEPFKASKEKYNVAEKELAKQQPSKLRVKMACMPTVPEFEEKLGAIDKTRPTEEKVMSVLVAMLPQNKKNVNSRFVDIGVAAVESDVQTIEEIMAKSHIRREDAKEARLTFAKFISDFAKKNGSHGKVKLIDFLLDLRAILK